MSEKQNQDLTILTADDDPDALNLISLGLSSLGYRIVEAHDGNEAIELFDKHKPDLAIIDLMMPGHSGGEVCRYIKQSKEGALVPVVILTACSKVEDKVEAFDCGADDYLIKPFHFQELSARVRAFLRVRELNLSLIEKNRQLVAAQEKLLQQEKQLLVMQIAGTAAHQLGQPLSAIMLNCHLLERLGPGDERYAKALNAIKQDAQRMAQLIEKLRHVDPEKKESYYAGTQILGMKDK